MTAIGINAAALQSPAGSFVSVTVSQISVSTGSDFGSVLSNKLNASDKTSDTGTPAAVRSQKTEYSKESTQVQSADNAQKGTPEQTAATQTAQSQSSETTQTVTSPDDTAPVSVTDGADAGGDAVSEDECLQALEALSTLLQGIADIVGCSIEELQESFEELNINPAEIFDTGSIAKLVMNLTGTDDMSGLLVDNDALALFNELKDFSASVLDDAGMTADEFETVVTSEEFAQTAVEPAADNLSELVGAAHELLTEIGKENPGSTDLSLKRLSGSDETKSGLKDQSAVESDTEPVEERFSVKTDRKNPEAGDSDDNAGDASSNSTEVRTKSTEVRTKSTEATKDSGFVQVGESFVSGLENALKTADIDMPVMEGVTVRDIVYQLVDAVKVEISPENTSLEVHLNPESLGRVNLSIQQKDGVMTAQIATENQVSKEALESQLQILKDNIEAQGIKVEAIEVTVSSFIFADSKNAESDSREQESAGKQRRGFNAGGIGTGSTETDVESLQREVMLQNGSTVVYTA